MKGSIQIGWTVGRHRLWLDIRSQQRMPEVRLIDIDAQDLIFQQVVLTCSYEDTLQFSPGNGGYYAGGVPSHKSIQIQRVGHKIRTDRRIESAVMFRQE